MKQYLLGLGLLGAAATSCFGPSRESMFVADQYVMNAEGKKEAIFLETYRADASLEQRVMCLAGVHVGMLRLKRNADETFQYEGSFHLVQNIAPLGNALREILPLLDGNKDEVITSDELARGEQELYNLQLNRRDMMFSLRLQIRDYDVTASQLNQLLVLGGVLSGAVRVNKKSQHQFAFEGDFNPALHPAYIPFLLKKADTNHDHLITDGEIASVAQEIFYQAGKKQDNNK